MVREGEENHPDAAKEAQAWWTEGARARMIGHASVQCGVARGRHRVNQLGDWVDPADSRLWAYSSTRPCRSQSRVRGVNLAVGADAIWKKHGRESGCGREGDP